MKITTYVFLLVFIFTPSLLRTAILHDPTQRPMKVIQNPELLHQKYLIDTIITKKHKKILQINRTRYQKGDYIDESIKIVAIKPNKIILQDGRHGYINLYLKKPKD